MTKPTGNGVATLGVASKNDKNTAKNSGENKQQTVINQPKPIEEFINNFLGLEKLVKMRRTLEHHKEAINDIALKDEELNVFELKTTHGLRITLYDSSRNSYEIANPSLVEDVKAYLLQRLDVKIADIDQQIISYNNSAA